MTRADEIARSLDTVRGRVDAALLAAQRSSSTLRLLAVSSMVPAEDVADAIAAGQLDFAESSEQEFREKYQSVANLVAARGLPEPRWHFIGPMQVNKIGFMTGKVALIHSIRSAGVLAAIDRKAGATSVVQDCLVQVNVVGSRRKNGVEPAGLPALLDSFVLTSHLRCIGLMVMPPYNQAAEHSRPHFVALRKLREQHRLRMRPNVVLGELSMGTSHDLELAIREGATILRVGTAIFGTRAGIAGQEPS